MRHSTWDVLMCNGEGGYASLELNKKKKTQKIKFQCGVHHSVLIRKNCA